MNKCKMVPVEPTADMVIAGEDAWVAQLDKRLFAKENGEPFATYPSEETHELCSRVAYRAMLAAAPAVQEEPVAWATRLYNAAYHAGHHDTADGGYTHVYPQDMDSYHEDIVREWLADNPQPTEQQLSPDISALVEALQMAVNRLEISGLYFSEAAIRGRATLAAHRKQEGSDNE